MCVVTLRLLLGVGLLLSSCSRSRMLNERPDATAGASGTGVSAVEPDASIPDAAGDFEACEEFMSVWQAKQAERIEGEAVPDEGAPCFDCIEAADCPRLTCYPALACLERHCLCTAERPAGARACRADEYPDDLCECADGCFADGDGECRQAWSEYMACVVTACRAVCS